MNKLLSVALLSLVACGLSSGQASAWTRRYCPCNPAYLKQDNAFAPCSLCWGYVDSNGYCAGAENVSAAALAPYTAVAGSPPAAPGYVTSGRVAAPAAGWPANSYPLARNALTTPTGR
jgi:hypothetical protein